MNECIFIITCLSTTGPRTKFSFVCSKGTAAPKQASRPYALQASMTLIQRVRTILVALLVVSLMTPAESIHTSRVGLQTGTFGQASRVLSQGSALEGSLRLRGGAPVPQLFTSVAARQAALAIRQAAIGSRRLMRSSGVALKVYERACQRYPFLVNGATIGILGIIGDVVQQTLEGAAATGYDLHRTLQFTAFKVGFVAPMYSIWYPWLERLRLHQMYAPLIKVLLGASVLTPLQHSVLFSSHAIFDGASLQEAVERTAKVLPKSVPTSWGFWIPVQFITFTAIAPPLRIAWVSTVSLVWNVILSGFNGAA